LPQKSLRDALLTGAHPGVDFDPVDGATSDRVPGLEEIKQELPAFATIIDDIYEERRIGEEARHQFRCVSPFVGSSSRRMDSTHCAAPSFSSGCFSRSQPGGFSPRNRSSRI